MKPWHLVLAVVVLAAAGVVVAQEVRYQGQVAVAKLKADSVRTMKAQLDATVEQLRLADADLEAERAVRLEAEQAAADSLQRLEEGLTGQREVTAMVEDLLRDHVAEDSAATAMVDDLVESHEAEMENVGATLVVVREELTAERRLRVQVDSTLFATRAALEDCQCALGSAVEALDVFEDVTDGRGWASRAWDSVTSPKGLLTLGVVGLAVKGAIDLAASGG